MTHQRHGCSEKPCELQKMMIGKSERPCNKYLAKGTRQGTRR